MRYRVATNFQFSILFPYVFFQYAGARSCKHTRVRAGASARTHKSHNIGLILRDNRCLLRIDLALAKLSDLVAAFRGPPSVFKYTPIKDNSR